MYFNYNLYYEDKEREQEILEDKEILKQIYKRNKDFFKTETYKRFFL
ncbi:hypothetical protein [Aliarcobacter butzleri]|nr:hypothetical protein [Aliarcobacter butzleri]MCT7637001.1 hypothetical protein [Aliarcobacter butzleri]